MIIMGLTLNLLKTNGSAITGYFAITYGAKQARKQQGIE